MEKKWLKAEVTYLGKGSYRCRNKYFRANRVVAVTNKSTRDYVASYPFFAVHDKFSPEKEEKVEEPIQPLVKQEKKEEAKEPDPLKAVIEPLPEKEKVEEPIQPPKKEEKKESSKNSKKSKARTKKVRVKGD